MAEIEVGRLSEERLFIQWLTAEDRDDAKPACLSLSGPGGIGKSFFLASTLRRCEDTLQKRRFLTLRVDGKGRRELLSDLLLRDLLRSSTEVDESRFKETARARRQLEKINVDACNQLERAAQADAQVRRALDLLVKLGLLVTEIVAPEAKGLTSAVKKHSPEVLQAVEVAFRHARAWREESQWRPGGRLRNALRSKLSETLADVLALDLAQNVFGDEQYLGRFERLLLIIDDYEALHEIAGEHFTQHLPLALQRHRVRARVIFVGRDSVADTHPGFTDRLDAYFSSYAEIKLKEFSRDEAEGFIRQHQISEPAVIERIIAETSGFPFLLDAEVRDQQEGGRSALGLERFYQRTTRWMTDEQRRWIVPLCFLEQVHNQSIRRIMPDEPTEQVMAWFKAEASIRAPTGKSWTVMPIIRSRIKEWLYNQDPERHAALEAQSRQGA